MQSLLNFNLRNKVSQRFKFLGAELNVGTYVSDLTPNNIIRIQNFVTDPDPKEYGSASTFFLHFDIVSYIYFKAYYIHIRTLLLLAV